MSVEKDAVMPHGYGWKLTAKQEAEAVRAGSAKGLTIYDISVPSEIGAYGVDAALALNAKNYVCAGDAFWGHALTSAQTYVNAIKRRLPSASVIDAGGARTTSMETRKLVDVAIQNEWKYLATVAVGDHYPRAVEVARKVSKKRRVKRAGITLEVFSAADVLTNPLSYGGGEEGQRKAEMEGRRFEAIKASDEYDSLVQHEKKARFIEKWHLTRVADVASRIFRPQVMSH